MLVCEPIAQLVFKFIRARPDGGPLQLAMAVVLAPGYTKMLIVPLLDKGFGSIFPSPLHTYIFGRSSRLHQGSTPSECGTLTLTMFAVT